ncbi:thermonuclease family protein [Rhodococcus aetherivorans]|uniref:thermonuclease family protein n=1 Tax=Rhodococcus aetherivorans TaxID=191292 RepID=UPI003890D3F4
MWDTAADSVLTVRTSVRLLHVDVPEVTACTVGGARRIDGRFARLARWLEQRPDLPVTGFLAEYLLPKLGTGRAGTVHVEQGRVAAAFAHANAAARLIRPDGTERPLFLRTAGTPFDHRGRLWAYVAPYYSAAERRGMTRAQRSTFNLDMVRAGWAVPFLVYPNLPATPDLAVLLDDTAGARAAGRGIWADPDTLLPFEYRAVERLYTIAESIVTGAPPPDPAAWQVLYCADMRTRVLHGPFDYVEVPLLDRLWLWPADVPEGLGRLKLTFSPRLLDTH